MLKSVEEALCAADPQNADTYHSNAAAYDAQLAGLDQTFRDLVSGAARTELVFADRFPFLYFAREYGLSYRSAFSGCSEEAQPSVQAVAALIDAVEQDGVPVIYVIELSTRTWPTRSPNRPGPRSWRCTPARASQARNSRPERRIFP